MNLYPTPAFHFKVKIEGAPATADASFEEVDGIGATIHTEQLQGGGDNGFTRYAPKSVTFPKLVLKRGVTSMDSDLVQWCQDTIMNWLDQSKVVRRQVLVHLLDEKGAPRYAWRFAEAFPVDWKLGAFNARKNEVAMETVQLVYSYWMREM